MCLTLKYLSSTSDDMMSDREMVWLIDVLIVLGQQWHRGISYGASDSCYIGRIC